MKIFSSLYMRVMQWSRHRLAVWYLCGLSFAESSFFPIPPDVMLAPMSLALPQKALFYATLTTLASVGGGVLGYAIGYSLFDWVEPLLHQYHYWPAYLTAKGWFEHWGFIAVLLAGFSPIPYKVFTIAAGAAVMPFFPFVIASFLGRGARFFLVAMLMAKGGAKMEARLARHVETVGWVTVSLVIIAVIVYRSAIT